MTIQKFTEATTDTLVTKSFHGGAFLQYVGDSKNILSTLPDETFQSCITSPPYWGLRDYNHINQIGAEPNLDAYVNSLVEIFRIVRAKLKKNGVLWLNIGDSYTSGNRKWRAKDKKNPGRAMSYRPDTPEGLKSKDLIGLPWRIAFALQADGWYLRSDIIWNKPNCQPESVKDRPTRSHEYIFLLSKSEKYYFDIESIKENSQSDSSSSRNRRSVWSINTKGFRGAHFAVFPPEMVEICVKGSTKVNDLILDPFSGTGTVGEVCLKNRRKCIGIEINPDYALLAEKRIEKIRTELFQSL